MTFGEKIRERRKSLKLSVAQLAKKAGLTRQMIYRYEENFNEPTFFNAIVLADTLGVSLNYLAGKDEEP